MSIPHLFHFAIRRKKPRLLIWYNECIMKRLLSCFLVGVIFVAFFLQVRPSFSDELDDINKQLIELIDALNKSKAATAPLESQLKNLRSQINDIKHQLQTIEENIILKKKNIDNSYKNLAKQQDILNLAIRDMYIKTYYNSPFLTLLSTPSKASRIAQVLAYQEAAADQDKVIITNIALSILDLEQKKQSLEDEQKRFLSVKGNLDEQSEKLDGIVQGAKTYQQTLSSKIAALSQKQQEILSAKSGTFQISVGDVPVADDPASQPGYNPGFSPAFAAFSFGAPHFNGLSQYGAYGRAKFGNQSAEDILRSYYGGVEIKKDYPTSTTICVGDGGGNCTHVDVETYTKRIYEVPNSWGGNGGMEALKAQAVAARSYALSSMSRNGYICPTESCQVYKSENKGGNWENAVNATSGWVMMVSGKPLFAKYASTAGGYIESYSSPEGHTTPGFWDAEGGRGGWTSQAWESKAGSPWFYKAWYKTRSGDACGKSHPWLTSEELADIINAWVVLVKHGQGDDRITPIGSCWGGNPYSISELRDKASLLSTGYGNVENVSVSYSDNGVTASVVFQTDKGEVSIKGSDFYKMFNLRAPSRISLKSGLFNIEKK